MLKNKNLLNQMSDTEGYGTENPVLDPNLTVDQLKDQADAPLFVAPELLQQVEVNDISNTPQQEEQSLDLPAELPSDNSGNFANRINRNNFINPVDRYSDLLDDYRKRLDTTFKDPSVQEARKTDDLYRLIGLSGDAISKIAQGGSQKRLGIPGVQITDAGLAKAAEAFTNNERRATADRRERQEQLLKELEAIQQGARLEQQGLIASANLTQRQVEAADENKRFLDALANRKTQFSDKRLDSIQTGFNKDKIVQKADERIQSAITIRDMVNGNPITQEAARTFAARASGEVGALSDQDRAAYGGSKALISRINQFAQQAATGELTEENRKFMIQLADLFEKSAKRDIDKRLDLYANQNIKKGVFQDESEAKDFLRPGYDVELSEQPKQKELSLKDKQALDWANANPKDPRSAQIKQKLGL